MSEQTENVRFAIGEIIRFAEEPQWPYTVKAINARYAILTRPWTEDGERTVMYTIVDNQTMMRGPNNLVFNNYDYATQQGIEDSLADLENGCIELSRRNSIPVVLAS